MATRIVPVRFRRDRMTVTFYGPFVLWGWFLYAFNPSVPRLGDELRVSDTLAGLHGIAAAVGAVAAALVTPSLVRRWGRRATIVAGAVLVAIGVATIVTGYVLPQTLAGALVACLGGNVAICAVQPGMVLHHGPASSAAVTEANGVGSGIGLLGPLAVGATVALGWGWRPAVAVTAVLALVSALLIARLPADPALGRPTVERHEDGSRVRPVRVPGARTAANLFLAAIVAAIAIENATTFWASDLIIARTGAGDGIATATTAGLVAGMTLIRFVVGPLSLRFEPAHLLAGAFAMAIAGWAIVWTATSTPVALVGLFVAGLGYGVQYPLSIALLLGAAPGGADRAQAEAAFAGGVAIGIGPLALGALADAVGAHAAFVVIPLVAAAGGVAAAWGGVVARRVSRPVVVPA